jgi:XTP/dITP diphosphohydrolase
MADFTFVTSNDHKVLTAQAVCKHFGLTFDRQNIDLIEIQADNGEVIAIQKALQAFETFKRPVAVTDDSWSTPGLNGFPGPYMKYINQWFKPEDFLRLTKDLKDRSMTMKHIIAYRDAQTEKIFSADIPATILKEIRGESQIPHFTLISLDGKNSVAEAEAQTGDSAFINQPNAWHQFCEWFQTHK